MMGSRAPIPTVAQWGQLVELVQQCGQSVAAELDKLRQEQDRTASTLASLAVVQAEHDRREEQIKGKEAQINCAETALKARDAAIAEREGEVKRLQGVLADEESRLVGWNNGLVLYQARLDEQEKSSQQQISGAQEHAAWLVTDAHAKANEITGSAEKATAIEKANLDADFEERRKQATAEREAQWATLREAQEQFQRRQVAAREVAARQLRSLLGE